MSTLTTIPTSTREPDPTTDAIHDPAADGPSSCAWDAPAGPPTPPPAVPVSAAELAAVVAAADQVATEASARAGEIELARTLPIDLVERMGQDGLLRLGLPRSLGGLEVDPATFIRVIETMAYGDGSTGWTAMIGNGTFFFAYLDPEVARSMIGVDGDVTAAGVFAPKGMARATAPGRFTVDGRWTFNSGVNHAAWHIQGVLLSDGGPPRLRPDGTPDWRFAYFPHDADVAPGGSIEVVDTWHSLGLRGTGSNDLVVQGVPVPEEHLVLPFVTDARHDGPLWRFSFVDLLAMMMTGVPLGIARRALDEVVAIVPARSRPGTTASMAADPVVQERLGRAESRLLGARAFLDDAIGSAWATACRGDRPSDAEHTRIQMAMIDALDASVGAVDTAFALAGSSAVLDGSPIQRCFRDIHTAAQHVAFASTPHQEWTRARLGG